MAPLVSANGPSATVTNLNHDMPDDLDRDFATMELLTISQDSLMRPLSWQHFLVTIGMNPHSRLAFRAQPQDPGSQIDRSFFHLYVDAIQTGILPHKLKLEMDDHIYLLQNVQQVSFLGHIDALAELPQSVWSPHMEQSQELLDKILVWRREQDWIPTMPKDIDGEINRLYGSAFSLRWLFYLGRRMGTRDYTTAEHVRLVEQCLSNAQVTWEEINDRFVYLTGLLEEEVELELIGPPIQVLQIATGIAASQIQEEGCTVCSETPEPGQAVQLRTCKHIFCNGCIKTWINKCRRNSHLCPNCRVEMFKKPQYRAKANTNSSLYDREVETCRARLRRLNNLQVSLEWLKDEIEMHLEILSIVRGS
ncbi:hypothetical protein BDV96DRAFT_666526 [Lophiotrema nucula]|uniref:RING-type domain-containing protein n=1 Tax=Lophiotrema nucula TaxID=690887 RepID=A0A6A5YVW7_9PLEO|nr:hypothetical protein BDV96DRAFT_666526 [Lophiotrema nucula]